MKICTKCNELKNLDDFTVDSRMKDKRRSSCKICTRLRDVNFRIEHKEKINSKRRESNKEKGEEVLIKQRIYREANKDRINELQIKLYHENMKDPEFREKRREKDKEYFAENKEDINAWRKEYVKTDGGVRNSDKARRRACKMQATINLTDEQLIEIDNIYGEAKRLTKETGIKMHVDHIIPLQHDKVCGLHVPWNLQILTASENTSKGNRFYE